jgi:hypothetical protein
MVVIACAAATDGVNESLLIVLGVLSVLSALNVCVCVLSVCALCVLCVCSLRVCFVDKWSRGFFTSTALAPSVRALEVAAVTVAVSSFLEQKSIVSVVIGNC